MNSISVSNTLIIDIKLRM